MAEEWREIPSTDYSVSDQGRVASRKFGKWRILSQKKNNWGYPTVAFSHTTRAAHFVHRLVAEAFIGPPPTPQHQVNHRNGVKTENCAENLEWMTCTENLRHRFTLGYRAARGECTAHARLTEKDVHNIRAKLCSGETQVKVASDFGITQVAVSYIATGKTWGWLK